MCGNSRKLAAPLNVRVDGQLVVNDIALARDGALRGLGIAYLPEDYVLPHLESGELVRVLSDWTPPFPGYHLYYPSRRQQSPALALLIEASALIEDGPARHCETRLPDR